MPASAEPPPVSALAPVNAQTLTIGFDCNNRCRMCLVERQRHRQPPMALHEFTAHVDQNARERRYNRLVLSGAEVTLHDELLAFIAYARASGAYDHIRVQTNGRRCADRSFAERLLAAGADELYVSVRAHRADIESAISGRAESFDELRRGLENLAGLDCTLITNTAMVRENWQHLTAIVDFVAEFKPARVEIYNLVPMRSEQVSLAVPLRQLAPALRRALDHATARSLETAVTWFPRCLLGEHAQVFEHHLPETVIATDFWDDFPPFACFFARVCRWYGPCEGLPHPYIETYGWEPNLLQPSPPASLVGAVTQTPPSPTAAADRDWRVGEFERCPWLQLLRAADGRPTVSAKLWRLCAIETDQHRVRFCFDLKTGHRIDVTLGRRDDTVAHAAQTTSFNVTCSSPAGRRPDRRLRDLFFFTLLPLLIRNDDGRLRLT